MKRLYRKKLKGFTLVEILAAVTILGILAVIAAVSVNNVIQSAKENHYKTAEEQLALAGQSYAQQNRDALPKAIGQKTTIPLKDLVNKNYIEKIKDYSGNECDLDNSYVQIFKYTTNDYSYLPVLDCPVYDSNEDSARHKPTITVTISNSDKLKSASVSMSATDQEKLLSWSYIVYRDEKEVFNSGSVMIKDYAKTVSKTMDISKYTPGELKVVVTATNIYGETTSKTVKQDFADTAGPSCIIKAEDNKDVVKAWTKNNVTITVGCDDGDGVGCKRVDYTKTFKSSAKTGKIRIEDKSGNYTDCEVAVYIDKTAPSVPSVSMYKWKNDSTAPTSTSGLTAYSNNSWSNKNVYTLASGSTDSHSGFDHYEYVTTGKTGNKNTSGSSYSVKEDGTSTIKYRACDKLGNCSAYTGVKTINIDRTPPSVPKIILSTVSGGENNYTSNTWINRTIYTRVNGSDSESDFSHYEYTTSGATTNDTEKSGSSRSIAAEGTSKIKYRACDTRGNCSAWTSEAIIKIDKTAPDLSNVSNSSGGSWTNSNVVISADASDEDSGMAEILYRYSDAWTRYSDWDSGTTATRAVGTWSAERDSEVYVIAVDNAGNETEVSAGKVRIDKTKPVITEKTNSSSDTWTNGSVKITGKASDTASGVKQIYYIYSNNINDTKYSDWDSGSTTTSVVGTWTAERNARVYLTAVDKAGNYADLVDAGTVMIDKTKPVITSIDNPSGGNATAPGLKLTLNGYDNGGSGIKNWSYKYASTNWAPYANSNYSPFVTTEFTTTRNEDVYIKVCDVAGNCSDEKTSKINIAGVCDTGYYTASYGEWSACTALCGGGTQTRTVTYTSTIDGSSCGSTVESQPCNTMDCCSDVRYEDGDQCTAECDGGTLNQLAYSNYDGSRCPSSDKTDGGSECNTQACLTLKGLCDYEDTELFGTGKGNLAGNYTNWTDDFGFSYTCYNGSNGTCSRRNGWYKVCVSDLCGPYKGWTAKEMNNKLIAEGGSKCFSNYWCSCKYEGKF